MGRDLEMKALLFLKHLLVYTQARQNHQLFYSPPKYLISASPLQTLVHSTNLFSDFEKKPNSYFLKTSTDFQLDSAKSSNHSNVSAPL